MQHLPCGWMPSCLGRLRADCFCNKFKTRVTLRGFWSPETRLFFLAYIVCMREARPDLSMRKTPPPCMIQRSRSMEFPHLVAQNETNQWASCAFLSSPPGCCHVARHVWLKSWIINKTNTCKNASVGFLFTGANLKSFSFQFLFVLFERLLLRHTMLQQWRFHETAKFALNPWVNSWTYRLMLQLSHLDQNEILEVKRKVNVYMSHIENLYQRRGRENKTLDPWQR